MSSDGNGPVTKEKVANVVQEEATADIKLDELDATSSNSETKRDGRRPSRPGACHISGPASGGRQDETFSQRQDCPSAPVPDQASEGDIPQFVRLRPDEGEIDDESVITLHRLEVGERLNPNSEGDDPLSGFTFALPGAVRVPGANTRESESDESSLEYDAPSDAALNQDSQDSFYRPQPAMSPPRELNAMGLRGTNTPQPLGSIQPREQTTITDEAPVLTGTLVVEENEAVLNADVTVLARNPSVERVDGVALPQRSHKKRGSRFYQQDIIDLFNCTGVKKGKLLFRLAMVAVAFVAIAIGLSVGLTRPLSHEGEESNPMPASSVGSAIPSSQPTSVPDNNTKQEAVWEELGSTIRGPHDQPGFAVTFAPTGWPYYHYNRTRSNFTLSGRSLSLSDNGQILAVGEAGVDRVRTFQWNNETEDWAPLGQDLIARPECLDEFHENLMIENATHNGGLLRRKRPLQHAHGLRRTAAWAGNETIFLPCYMGFGFNAELSGDGSVISVAATGYNGSRGLVRNFRLEEGGEGSGMNGKTSKQWVQVGQDIVGNDPTDLMGGYVSLSNDGRTLLAAAPQSIPQNFSAQLGMRSYSGRGYIRVYDLHEGGGSNASSGIWVQRGNDIRGPDENSGMGSCDISIDGQAVIFVTLYGGLVEVHTWNNNTDSWTLRTPSLKAPLGESEFGTPVSFASEDGSRVFVGSRFKSNVLAQTSSANLVYLYEWDGESWLKLQRLVVASGMSYEQRPSPAVSTDGMTLSIAFSRGVLVFQWDGSRYVQKGEVIASGWRVAVSDDGSIVAVGRPYDFSAGFGIGSTTVYKYGGSH